MTWLSRFKAMILPRCAAVDDTGRVDEAFHRTMTAQRHRREAAEGVLRANETHIARVEAEQGRIQQRTVEQVAKRRRRQTSGVREMIEDTLVGFLPENERKG